MKFALWPLSMNVVSANAARPEGRWIGDRKSGGGCGAGLFDHSHRALLPIVASPLRRQARRREGTDRFFLPDRATNYAAAK
jgi:hypothetical protein